MRLYGFIFKHWCRKSEFIYELNNSLYVDGMNTANPKYPVAIVQIEICAVIRIPALYVVDDDGRIKAIMYIGPENFDHVTMLMSNSKFNIRSCSTRGGSRQIPWLYETFDIQFPYL